MSSSVVMTRGYEEFCTKEKSTVQALSEAKDEVGQAHEVSQASTRPLVTTFEISMHTLCKLVSEVISNQTRFNE